MSIYPFKYRSSLILLFVLFLGNSCIAQPASSIKAEGYVLSATLNTKSEYWAAYAYKHLSNRTKDKSILLLQKSNNQEMPKGFLNIHFEVSKSLGSDYCTRFENGILYLKAQDDRTAIWLVYQLIETIAQEDPRFTADDLPPSVLDLKKDNCKNFDFAYREPSFPQNLKAGFAAILGTNSLDADWGLWGHNISKSLSDTSDKSLYALINGKRTKEQFCFSSPALFNQISNYIIDNYGNGAKRSYNFMILSEDNNLVCTDKACIQLGNTPNNATPAVSFLIRKLAKRFPDDYFFTTAYKTTISPPSSLLPKNSGVFVSTILLPKGVILSQNQPDTRKFIDLVNEWKQKTTNVYVWDYAANFDDYLTPIPILYGLQKQLRFYKKWGINGIFLEGSDYAYSPFEYLKSYVAGALMMNVDANIDSLCQEFFKKDYPYSHIFLCHYYLNLEKSFSKKNKSYDLYGGTEGALHTYIDEARFIKFYQELNQIIPKTDGIEKERLQKLYTALTFTRLQISYFGGADSLGYAQLKNKTMFVKQEVADWVSNLKQYVKYKDMNTYRESNGDLAAYCSYWERLVADKEYENQLIGTVINNLSKKGDDSDDGSTNLLNNGTPGFDLDYHQGWYITNTTLHLEFATNNLQGKKLVSMDFLMDKRHGFYPPKKIVCFVDGKEVRVISANDMKDGKRETVCRFVIDLLQSKKMDIYFYLKPVIKSKLACDEIQITNAK